ncbi:MAG TPA: hypothetical protein VGF67_27790 [Ktedonobacteraceae bacterium]
MVFPGSISNQAPSTYDARVACIGPLPSLYTVGEQGRRYGVRRLSWGDAARHDEYQRLRASIFVHQLGWDIPVDERGRERDCYDWQENALVSMHCVYGQGQDNAEYLLGGVRVFDLETWDDSMVMHEFYDAGMIPGSVLQTLEKHYDCRTLLELTRLCVRRGRWYAPPGPLLYTPGFSCLMARDLTYAAVYAQAEQTGRWHAIGLAESRYLQVMRRSHFVFQEIYARGTEQKSGYALVLIDLLATLQALRTAGEYHRAQRMLALCAASL